MSAYNAQRAKHAFIDTTFTPYGHVDPNDSKGGVPREICEQGVQQTNMKTISNGPNSIKIQIPATHLVHSGQADWSMGNNMGGPTLASSHPNALEIAAHSSMDTTVSMIECTPSGSHPISLGVPVHSSNNASDLALSGDHLNSLQVNPCTPTNATVNAPMADTLKLTIQIPAPSLIRQSRPVAEDEPDTDEDITTRRRTFCLIELHDAIPEMME